MAVRPDNRAQFDFDFEQEPYSYAAEQALSEQERSLEELEAAVKETPPRPSMSLTNGHGRTSSEPRALGDVIDESERLLPLGSPGLRHTKGRLETKLSPKAESFADITKHEPPSTPSKSSNDRSKKRTPSITEGFPKIIKGGTPNPVAHPETMAKQEKNVDAPTSEKEAHASSTPGAAVHTEESYADVVKHEPSEKKDTQHMHTINGDGNPTQQKQADHKTEPLEAPKAGANGESDKRGLEGLDAKQLENKPEHEDAAQPSKTTNGESYAEAVKHEPTSPIIRPQKEIRDADDRSKPEEDFADGATAVADDDTSQSFVGTGKDASPRSPHRKATKKGSARSLNSASKALQQALHETETLPKETKDQQDDQPQQDEESQPGTLVYENYQSRSGTNLASIQLEPEYDLALAQQKNKDIASDGTSSIEVKSNNRDSKLVSGRRAGAGWARSAIRWAPLNVPLQRRLQTLAVLAHSLSIAGLLAFFFFLCAIPLFWPVLLPYLIYVLLSRASSDGKLTYRSEWIRRSKFWSLFASYFPARLHRTVELEPNRKYIFGYHPHGIISHGAIAAFATEALGFGQLFPGITNTLLTLDSNFRVPLYRDWALRLGLASVSRESCENLLSKGGPNGEGMGRAITIVIGGARESLDAKPGTLNLVLAKRKGFVKLAVRAGADLVPVLAFGENDMYEQISSDTHPWIHKGQMLLKKFMGFTVPLFHARGIFNYDVGIMPYRRPINIVVGRPIRTVQSKKPDSEYIDQLHKQYTDELLHIWEEWKDVFAPQRNCELAIVE